MKSRKKNFAPAQQRIAVFASFSGQGGVERMIVNLCRGMVEHGHPVDLVLVRSASQHLANLPEEVRIVKLGRRHTLSSIAALTGYLRHERPAALLAAKDRAARVAVLARRLSGCDCRLVFRMGTTLSAALAGKNALRRFAWYLPMRLIYRHADAIVGVSQGVVDDLRKITGLPAGKFRVIDNPVITPDLETMSREPVAHPWFGSGEVPVVMGIGRLTRQKDFPTLLRAFAIVAQRRDCRLLILGDGRDRQHLLDLGASLGISAKMDLVGFQPNPYAYLRQADLFVLSSAWEGSPNALTEAMALGVPVVATDCPSGPREILQGGKLAPLVPVGDHQALAEAMADSLDNPPPGEKMSRAVAGFAMATSSRRYLDLLLGEEGNVK